MGCTPITRLALLLILGLAATGQASAAVAAGGRIGVATLVARSGCPPRRPHHGRAPDRGKRAVGTDVETTRSFAFRPWPTFGEGTRLAITEAAQPSLGAGTRWALAGGIAAFAVSLAVVHIGAEWTSLGDSTFLGRLSLTTVTVTLAAAGNGIAPLTFVGLLAAAVFAQLLLEAVTVREGATTAWHAATRED